MAVTYWGNQSWYNTQFLVYEKHTSTATTNSYIGYDTLYTWKPTFEKINNKNYPFPDDM